jgi:hypothetical protein
MKKQPFNEVAVTSAVLGILGVILSILKILVVEGKIDNETFRGLYQYSCSYSLILMFGILATFFGVIAIDQFRNNKGEKRGLGFAITAITTGILSCAVYIRLFFYLVSQF